MFSVNSRCTVLNPRPLVPEVTALSITTTQEKSWNSSWQWLWLCWQSICFRLQRSPVRIRPFSEFSKNIYFTVKCIEKIKMKNKRLRRVDLFFKKLKPYDVSTNAKITQKPNLKKRWNICGFKNRIFWVTQDRHFWLPEILQKVTTLFDRRNQQGINSATLF